MDYTIENVRDNIKEIKKLAELHYKEVAPYDDIPLNIAFHRYIALENSGMLKLYVARDNGVMIGYSAFIVNFNIDYSESLQASMVNLFLHPDHRGEGKNFIIWCDKQLKRLGVQVVYHHVKNKNNYGVLLERLGYEIMNVEYSKRLDEE